jgi:hypothetical protein
LITIVSLIIEDKIDILEGSRLVDRLSSQAGVRDNDIFLPIISFVSQAEHILTGDVRKNGDTNYLKQNDQEKEGYVREFKDEIVSACKQMVTNYQ